MILPLYFPFFFVHIVQWFRRSEAHSWRPPSPLAAPLGPHGSTPRTPRSRPAAPARVLSRAPPGFPLGAWKPHGDPRHMEGKIRLDVIWKIQEIIREELEY